MAIYTDEQHLEALDAAIVARLSDDTIHTKSAGGTGLARAYTKEPLETLYRLRAEFYARVYGDPSVNDPISLATFP